MSSRCLHAGRPCLIKIWFAGDHNKQGSRGLTDFPPGPTPVSLPLRIGSWGEGGNGDSKELCQMLNRRSWIKKLASEYSNRNLGPSQAIHNDSFTTLLSSTINADNGSSYRLLVGRPAGWLAGRAAAHRRPAAADTRFL